VWGLPISLTDILIAGQNGVSAAASESITKSTSPQTGSASTVFGLK
jgi:hypothetical protein